MTLNVFRFTGINSTLAIKGPARCATTANIALIGLQAIDGVTLVSTDTNLRVLVKNQTDARQNGIYDAQSGNWTRSTDWDTNDDFISGTRVIVAGGTTQQGIWVLTTPDPITVGTSNMTFVPSFTTDFINSGRVNSFDVIAPTTTRGDLIENSGTTNVRIPLSGGANAVLQNNGTDPAWVAASAAFDSLSPTTTRGDLIARGAASNQRLALGTSGYHVQSNGTDPVWAGFLQAGTGALTRTWQNKGRDWVSALDFAVGDGVTDDSTAIQNAINSLTTGGTVYFPNAPGGFYKIGSATAITLPDTVPICLIGAGRNEGSGAILRAGASITAVITTATNSFVRGHRISGLTIDGNAQAQYCLKIDHAFSGVFDNLFLYNATLITFRLGDGVHPCEENVIFSVRMSSNDSYAFGSLPTYNLEINSTNNDIIAVKVASAQTANFHSGSGAVNNKYVNLHGYGHVSGNPTNNFLIDGGGEQFFNWECDGSTTANVQVNGGGNLFVGGICQFQGVAAQIGLRWATGTSGNFAVCNTFSNSTFANCIVQAGTPIAQGNFSAFNNSTAGGQLLQSFIDCNSGYTKQIPVNGFTISMTNYQAELIIDPAGALASGSVNLPTFPTDGQTCRMSTTQTITSFTVTPTGGASIKNPISAAAFNAGSAATWRYVIGNTTWYRIQ